MPSRRLAFAYLLSLALHLAILAGSHLLASRRPPPRATPAMLEAVLVPVPQEAERLLKNTLAEEQPKTAQPPHPAAPQPAARPQRQSAEAAQRKLAKHLYYPAEAVARGLEGETRLLLTLAADGRIADAQVASSSGHALLDQAALRAAWSMGRLEAAGQRELILPVLFRLQP
jgi:protein TonB